MSMHCLCVTNNPKIYELVQGCEKVNGGGVAVLTRARDLVHRGWILLCHPLYGNFHPKKHPFRTLILSRDEGHVTSFDSLALIENALIISSEKQYEELLPDLLTKNIAEDFAMLDYELIKETLRSYALIKRA